MASKEKVKTGNTDRNTRTTDRKFRSGMSLDDVPEAQIGRLKTFKQGVFIGKAMGRFKQGKNTDTYESFKQPFQPATEDP